MRSCSGFGSHLTSLETCILCTDFQYFLPEVISWQFFPAATFPIAPSPPPPPPPNQKRFKIPLLQDSLDGGFDRLNFKFPLLNSSQSDHVPFLVHSLRRLTGAGGPGNENVYKMWKNVGWPFRRIFPVCKHM